MKIMNSFVFRTPLDVNSAKMVRNTVSKNIYFSLRENVIRRINSEIKGKNSTTDTHCVAILDMPGFGK